MSELFQSKLLPPDPRRHLASREIAGYQGYWPYAEDPNVFPWRATHRLHFTVRGIPQPPVDVMFVCRTLCNCDFDGVPAHYNWYGYEQHQWHVNGTTGWTFTQVAPRPDVPHVLKHNGPWRGDPDSLMMERISGEW